MIFSGCGTALVTPFKENGEVDFEAYAALVGRQIAGGVDFLTALATTGETPTLSLEEKRKLLGLTSANAGGKPILVGCGSNSVPGTMTNIEALDCGAVTAWLVVVPFYNKPTQEGQYRYFKEIASRTSKPIVIYNVPGRTGANMEAATCLRIAADCPGIIGIKEASGKLEQVKEIISAAPEGFAVLSGDDDLTLEIMRAGGHGVISVASNIAPSMLSAMTKAAAEGDFTAAEKLDKELSGLYRACFLESNPIPAKEALRQLGLCSNTMRLPLVPASEKVCEEMRNVLSALRV